MTEITKEQKRSIYYEQGWSVALSDGSIDSCKLIKHNRRADWFNGFNNATQKMKKSPEKLTTQQEETNQKNISDLINFLDS